MAQLGVVLKRPQKHSASNSLMPAATITWVLLASMRPTLFHVKQQRNGLQFPRPWEVARRGSSMEVAAHMWTLSGP